MDNPEEVLRKEEWIGLSYTPERDRAGKVKTIVAYPDNNISQALDIINDISWEVIIFHTFDNHNS